MFDTLKAGGRYGPASSPAGGMIPGKHLPISAFGGRIRAAPPLARAPLTCQGGRLFFVRGGEKTRTAYITEKDLEVVYSLLMPQNRLICKFAAHTGLRIGDVLAIQTDQLAQRMMVQEHKTGKKRRIYVPADLLHDVEDQAGPLWAFPGAPGSQTGHKTRQAVWKDIKRAQRAMRLPDPIGPHSLRKVYAVRKFRKTGDLEAVQRALNHDDPAVTMLYAMADHVHTQRTRRNPRRGG